MNSRGQSLVLMVMFLPIIIIIFIGITELGNVLYWKNNLANTVLTCRDSNDIKKCLNKNKITNVTIKDKKIIAKKQIKGIIYQQKIIVTYTD